MEREILKMVEEMNLVVLLAEIVMLVVVAVKFWEVVVMN